MGIRVMASLLAVSDPGAAVLVLLSGRVGMM